MSIFHEDYYASMDKDAQKLIDVVLRNSQRMGMLIDDLLAFSRLGRQEITKAFFSMRHLVMEILEEHNKMEKEHVIEFSVDELPDVESERNLIRQVWVNLISNAIKYSSNKEKIKIRISFEKKEEEIIYSIQDNGAGFNMAYYDKLFGVFQRLHSQQEFTGTGVGLAIVQKIVEKHKGRIWAESKVDEGATFYFSLPI
jgi:light-regulated signal transduction histidine kinase (bacteriophytochrome)